MLRGLTLKEYCPVVVLLSCVTLFIKKYVIKQITMMLLNFNFLKTHTARFWTLSWMSNVVYYVWEYLVFFWYYSKALIRRLVSFLLESFFFWMCKTSKNRFLVLNFKDLHNRFIATIGVIWKPIFLFFVCI